MENICEICILERLNYIKFIERPLKIDYIKVRMEKY